MLSNDSTRFRKACIFTTLTLRENTCTIASGDYSTPVSQRWIYDLNSVNGIYIQGEKIEHKSKLNFPALVSMGDSEIMLRMQTAGQCIETDKETTKDSVDTPLVKGVPDVNTQRNRDKEAMITRLFSQEVAEDAGDYTRMMRALIHEDRTRLGKKYKKTIWGLGILFLLSAGLVTHRYKLDRDLFKTAVAVRDDKTPVSIVAVDPNGARVSQEFLLSREVQQRRTRQSQASHLRWIYGKISTLAIIMH